MAQESYGFEIQYIENTHGEVNSQLSVPLA